MRYIRIQKHKNTCGPIAVLNYLKVMGIKAPYSKMKFHKNLTTLREMCVYLKEFKPRLVRCLTVRHLEKLYKYHAIILLYRGNRCNHYVFVDDITPGVVVAPNAHPSGCSYISKIWLAGRLKYALLLPKNN